MSNWDKLWEDMSEVPAGFETYMYYFYKQMLGNQSFKGKKVLEIGCGTGLCSILMAIEGAKVTFFDKSPESLKLVKKNLKELGVDGTLVRGDALNMDKNLYSKFDVSLSEGLIEHFRGKQRQDIVDAHSRVLKRGGISIIVVPAKHNLPYQLGKYFANKFGTWPYGNEYPYSRKELIERMRIAGLETKKLWGGEMLFSTFWLFAPLWLKSTNIIKKGVSSPMSRPVARLNYNRLAAYTGRVIGAIGRKE